MVDDNKTPESLVSKEINVIEGAQLDARPVPTLDEPDLPHGMLGRLLVKLNIAQSGASVVIKSALLFVLIAFLPLLVLCIFQGTALPGSVKVPLLGDAITLSRLLLVAPILMLSDLLTRPWLIKVAEHFLGTFIEAEDVDDYKSMFKGVFMIRNSVLIDGCLFVLAFVSSIFQASMVVALDISSWQLIGIHSHPVLSIPGWWNAAISQPLFRFVILSWSFDYLLWFYFLFKVSRFKLKVIATHPDGAGGLAFVSVAQTPFCISAFALSAAISSVVAHAVLYTHMKLQSFTNLGIVFLALMLLIFVGPLVVFTPTLLRTKLKSVFSFGALCHEMSTLFAAKWLVPRAEGDPKILDSADSSALADLNSSYVTMSSMRPFIFNHKFVMTFAVASALPALPLVATVMPLKDILMQILKALT
jgi:hypothetical protein